MKTMNYRRSIFSKMLVILCMVSWMIAFGGISRASVFVVTNTNNSGTGSLRLAMTNADKTAGKDTIKFNIQGAGPHLFRPTPVFLLPTQREPVVIDGTTQPDWADTGTPVIVLDGIFAGSGIDGIVLRGGDSMVKGLAIIRFADRGIEIRSTGNTIEGNYIGISSDGVTAAGNGTDGVVIFESNNTVGGTSTAARNIISGNNGRGIFINTIAQSSGLVSNNVIQGNYIGTASNGITARGNRLHNIEIKNAADNTIGGPGVGNIISASRQGHGIRIFSNDGTSSGNIVQGNLIGTDVSGSLDRGNALNGILVQSAFDNLIGGTVEGAGNIISGNNRRGIEIINSMSTGNLVQGNFIGTDSTGTSFLGNLFNGILIGDASGNTIGGADAAARNVISGNGSKGVDKNRHGIRISLFAPGVADNNVIEGNYIGTDITGDALLGNLPMNENAGAGIFLEGAANTVIKDNLISGNLNGIVLDGQMFPNQPTENNIIKGNLIGTDASGSKAIHNRFNGISFLKTSNNTIGGTDKADRNIISGNLLNGIRISSEGGVSINNVIQGNYIGVNAAASGVIPNLSVGVFAADGGASGTIIGGTEIGAGNVIAGQVRNISLNSDDNRVQGNYIGTNISGDSLAGNIGVWLLNSSNNEIGGFEPGAGNIISHHIDSGIILVASSKNLIARNTITLNDTNGVKITQTGTGNAIRENSIHSNNSLGIDLGADDITLNDPNDADTGPNNFQNHPLLITATLTNGLAISVSFGSLANTEFIIEYFSNSECDTLGYGEGQSFIGADTIMTDANGDAFFTSPFSTMLSGTEYITATATDTAGNTSEFCRCIQIETVITPPNAPDLVAPADAATNVPLNKTFVWTQSSGVDRYHIQLSTDMNFSSIVYEDSSLAGTTQTTAQSLGSSTTYYWRVRAHNILGWSNYSAAFSFQVGASPIAPSLISPVHQASDLSTTVTFTWAPIQGATAYHLQLSTDVNFSSLTVNDSTLADSTREVPSLTEGSKYYWRVRVENAFGWGPYSETRTFEVLKATSVEEASNIPNVFVLRQNYPNPFNPSTSISYELPKAENVRILIYDLAGRQVRELVNEHKQAGIYTALWDGRSQRGLLVASGLYIYQIHAGEFSQILKMTLLK